MYAGAFDEPTSSYAFKVLAERARLEQMLMQRPRGLTPCSRVGGEWRVAGCQLVPGAALST